MFLFGVFSFFIEAQNMFNVFIPSVCVLHLSLQL